MSGRNLSSVVPVDVFMLPQPWRAQAMRSGSTVTVSVTGPAYARQAPMFHHMHGVSAGTLYDDAVPDLIGDLKRVDLKRLVSVPLIFVELERMSSDKKGPLPFLRGPKAVVATSLDVEPERIQETVPGLSFTLALKKWTFTLAIPEEALKKPLAIRVNLASIHANSRARNLDIDQRRWSKAPDGTDDLFHASALDGAAVLLPEPITFHIPLPFCTQNSRGQPDRDEAIALRCGIVITRFGEANVQSTRPTARSRQPLIHAHASSSTQAIVARGRFHDGQAGDELRSPNEADVAKR